MFLAAPAKADFRVGDTISTDPDLIFEEIPRFAPECFAFLHNSIPSKYKAFRKGMEHLLAEDVVQAFQVHEHTSTLPLLGAVGPLQFEVMQYRLKDEYGAESTLEPMPWKILRWLETPFASVDTEKPLPSGVSLAVDDRGRQVILFPAEWSLTYFCGNNPEIRLLDSSGTIG
jgi:peptide chain release factor 3